ncbi:MAG: metallophosphoesterase family protein [Burkholderiales bacterium]
MFRKGKCIALLMASVSIFAQADPLDDTNDDSRSARPVSFALIGDVPYSAIEATKFDRVIDRINQDKDVRFVVHMGDIKSGSSTCDDATYVTRFNQYQKLRAPFIYTPGDNEWTDCHRPAAGKFNPLERLQKIRQIFYPNPGYSTGQRTMRLTTQSTYTGYQTFVENSLWSRGGATFAMVHVVGSNNNLDPWLGIDATDSYTTPRADRLAEFTERENAAIAWLETIFAEAQIKNSAGVFVSMQADPNFELKATDQQRLGFNRFLNKLRDLTVAFKKPVVLTHGDSHFFRIDKPMVADTLDAGKDQMLENFTRVEGFGTPNVHWVKVNANARDPNVFMFEQKLIDENRFAR